VAGWSDFPEKISPPHVCEETDLKPVFLLPETILCTRKGMENQDIDKIPDDEADFWENGQCFDCAHWIQVHRYCTWNQGGYIISWKKCQGRAFAEIRQE